jgi:hypothetical protein
LRELLVHIAIVTLGILIALGLEQVRETAHERYLVRETRALLHDDMRAAREQLGKELQNVDEMARQLAQLHEELPELARNAPQLQVRIGAILPAEYFFSTSPWQTALSMGALVHMPVREVAELNEVYFLMEEYSRLEHSLVPLFYDFRGFGMSRGAFRAEDLETLNEKRCRFAFQVTSMAHVGQQLGVALDSALGDPVRSTRKYQFPGC